MSDQYTIAIDAMGGDHGVKSTIPGAAQTLKEMPQNTFIFFGDESATEFNDDSSHHDSPQESNLHECAYKTQDSIVCGG